MSEPMKTFTLPAGRVINHSLFSKDKFNEAAKAKYNVEIAYPKGTLDAFNDFMLDVATDIWGKGADEDDDLVLPIKDGDEMAAKKAENGKQGDAYEGMDVIRASTTFNANGDDAEGGVKVLDLDAKSLISPLEQDKVYRGCMMRAAVTVGTYTQNVTGFNAMNLYLKAVQKVGEGDRLGGDGEDADLGFEAVAPASGKSKRKG